VKHQHLMLIPSLDCPAACTYCFGPHEGGPSMKQATLEAIVAWLITLYVEDTLLEITFHGGEPLLVGADFYRMAMPLLRDSLAPCKVRFGLQSNLWLLTDELCELFQEHHVSIGTSLDGPEPINDAQRGAGYYRRTMDGIELARLHGFSVGCICTFTRESARQVDQVFEFFLQEGLDFSVHAALPPLEQSTNGWVLPPDAHGQLLVDLLDRYLPEADKIRISTLDALCRSISSGKGSICTFRDCLGEYLAVDPEGWIYACQRFAGLPQYHLGNVHDCPTMDDLMSSPFWRLLQDRQDRIETECGDCPYLDICRGGCPYNVLAANHGNFDSTLRDPHCSAYQGIFSQFTDLAIDEVFSEVNLNAVVDRGTEKYGLMHKGRLLQIMRGGPHPKKVAQKAREVVSAVALAVSDSPEDALYKLEQVGFITHPERALRSLAAMQEHLDTQSQGRLLNAYIHVTNACNLHCTHCYASSGPGSSPAMRVEQVKSLVHQAAQAGFNKTVITGGEPLMHPQSGRLLDALAELRAQVKPLQIVLRTNLAYCLSPTLLERLSCSTDQVVVSVDGDQVSHDARRGDGTYARTESNLRTLKAINPSAEVRITAVLTTAQIEGAEGDAVRTLAEELGLRVRFKAVLPLGRGRELELKPDFYTSLNDGTERLAYGTHLASTCGLGMNLYIAPDGTCYPCYALTGAPHDLGNALDGGLTIVLARNDAYRRVTVDSNEKCSQCALRYLCGGFCRAWSVADAPDAPPLDCKELSTRAENILLHALDALNVKAEAWRKVDLPLPNCSSI